ncbi:MAG: hypothetical protein ACXWFB_13190 [Nitrososphaeraceae archaeon]
MINENEKLTSNDICDLYYQMRYLSQLCEQGFDYQNLNELFKAILLIEPMKLNIEELYSLTRLAIKG